jgi:hypothetical protein
MPYPNAHAWPAELPMWTLADHTLRAGERVEATPFEQGEDRHREIRTFTPWLAQVSTKPLTQAQFNRLCEWFDDDLQAGALRFDVPMHSLEGAGPQWWEAQFVGPFRWEARSARYLVTAELILLDGPYPFFDPNTGAPVRVTPTLSARFVVDSLVTARPDTAALLARFDGDSEIQVRSDPTLRARFEGDSEIRGLLKLGFLLLPDGASYLLLPDGGRLQLPD